MRDNKINWLGLVFEYLMLVIGSIIMALALNLFLGPNVIAPGGVTGLAVVINETIGVPIYISNLAMNIPLFLFGAKALGRTSAIRTFFTTAIFTVVLKYTPYVSVTNDLTLAALFGGVLTGVGLGIIFKFGGTTGGSDLLGAIVNKKFPRFKIASVMMGIDTLVVILAGVVEKKAEITLYSVIALYASAKLVDMILEGFKYSKAFYIITSKTEEISADLMEELERGVTALKGKGMYTKEDKDVLLCVVNRTQFARAKEIVHEHDPNAFIMVTEMQEVLGEGFSYD